MGNPSGLEAKPSEVGRGDQACNWEGKLGGCLGGGVDGRDGGSVGRGVGGGNGGGLFISSGGLGEVGGDCAFFKNSLTSYFFLSNSVGGR